MILVIAEQCAATLRPVTWETIAAAQQIGGSVKIAVVGVGVSAVAEELSMADVDEVIVVEHAALEPYTPDGFVEALSQVIAVEQPEFVLLPHTYQVRDYAPTLATRLERVLVTDCIGSKRRDGNVVLVRPMFQGKFVADVALDGPAPHFVSFQSGSYRADVATRGTVPTGVRTADVMIDTVVIRQHPGTPFKEAKQAVDLTQADRIVSVGRGIKSRDHLPLVQELASVLDAELAASRPICDSGWLPMDRQIGSSGQTVAPKLYVAIGISGAIQHLVGMKGAHTVVAINKDSDAPIFEVADYGIVGDLFEVVPALLAALED